MNSIDEKKKKIMKLFKTAATTTATTINQVMHSYERTHAPTHKQINNEQFLPIDIAERHINKSRVIII